MHIHNRITNLEMYGLQGSPYFVKKKISLYVATGPASRAVPVCFQALPVDFPREDLRQILGDEITYWFSFAEVNIAVFHDQQAGGEKGCLDVWTALLKSRVSQVSGDAP